MQTYQRLSEIASIKTGPFGSQLHKEDYKQTGTPIVTVEHLGERKLSSKNLPLVGAEDRERLSAYSLIEGDIVFSRVGSIDRCSLVSKDEEGWLFSGRCLRVRVNPNIADPRFVYYALNTPGTKAFISSIAVGATMPSINTSLLGEVEVPIPEMREQRKIADFLSSLDDKVESNKRAADISDDLANSFLKQETRNSSSGSALGEEIQLNYGKSLPKSIRVDGEFPVIGSGGIVDTHNDALVDGPTIVIGRKGSIGTVYWVSTPCYPIDTTFWISSKRMPLEILYYLLSSIDFSSSNTDSAVPGLNRTNAYNLQVPSLSEHSIYSLTKKIKPLRNLVDALLAENLTLNNTRTELLPLLISGKITISDAEDRLEYIDEVAKNV